MLIGELAKAAGVSKDTIRHYDNLTLLKVGERHAGSRIYREYSPENVSRIQMIRASKDMGFTLSEVQKLSHAYDAGNLSDDDVKLILVKNLKLVQDKIVALKHTEKLLKSKLKNY